jgi:ABC-type lipoprotein export system ATPase subunit/ABC-type lipoprotein release transport system permease subunit
MKLITLKNITKTYQNGNHNLHALNDINLSFKAGEMVFILGESGSGKSTLLNVISGLDTPTKGSIIINGKSTKDFTNLDYAKFRNQHVGFVFQEYNLIEHLSVIENVMLPLLLQGKTKSEAYQLAKEELVNIGLEKHIDKKPLQLSGGQQQRVSIARSLVTKPSVIMADEPTGALDETLGEKVVAYLKSMTTSRVTIVVTHDEDLAHKYADRIIRIADGKIIDDTKALEATQEEKSFELKDTRMRLGMLFKFARNNISSRMARNIFTSSIVSIGFIAVLLLSFIVYGITTSLSDSIAGLFPPDEYQITSMDNSLIEEAMVTELENEPIIESVRYQIYQPFLTTYDFNPDETFYISYQAIPVDPLYFTREADFLGDMPSSDDEVIINLSTALDLLGLNASDDESYEYIYERLAGRQIRIYESIPMFDSFGEFIGEERELIDILTIKGITFTSGMSTVYLDYDYLKNTVDSINDDMFIEYKMRVTVLLNTSNEDAIEALTLRLRDDERLIMRNLYEDMTSEIESTMFRTLSWLIGISMITLVVSSILIGLVIYTSVLERIKEIGILTALGAKAKNIKHIFVIEAGITGLISSIIAVLLSILIGRGLNRLFVSIIARPLEFLSGGALDIELLRINALVVFAVVLFSIVYAMLSGLIPASYAARLKAIKALRRE